MNLGTKTKYGLEKIKPFAEMSTAAKAIVNSQDFKVDKELKQANDLTFSFLKSDNPAPLSNYSEDEILFQIEHISHNKKLSLIKKGLSSC